MPLESSCVIQIMWSLVGVVLDSLMGERSRSSVVALCLKNIVVMHSNAVFGQDP